MVMNVSTKRDDRIFSRAGCEVSRRIPLDERLEGPLVLSIASGILKWEMDEEVDMVRCLCGGLDTGGPLPGDRTLELGKVGFDAVLRRGVVSKAEPESREPSLTVPEEILDRMVEDLRRPRFLPNVRSKSSDRCPCSAYWGCSEGLLRAEVNSSRTGNGVKLAMWTAVMCRTRRFIDACKSQTRESVCAKQNQ